MFLVLCERGVGDWAAVGRLGGASGSDTSQAGRPRLASPRHAAPTPSPLHGQAGPPGPGACWALGSRGTRAPPHPAPSRYESARWQLILRPDFNHPATGSSVVWATCMHTLHPHRSERVARGQTGHSLSPAQGSASPSAAWSLRSPLAGLGGQGLSGDQASPLGGCSEPQWAPPSRNLD